MGSCHHPGPRSRARPLPICPDLKISMILIQQKHRNGTTEMPTRKIVSHLASRGTQIGFRLIWNNKKDYFLTVSQSSYSLFYLVLIVTQQDRNHYFRF